MLLVVCLEANKRVQYARLCVCYSYSASVRRLVCLAYEALMEVTRADASAQAAAAMHAAIRDLFELFCDIVPFYHRQRITTSPLHAGTPCCTSISNVAVVSRA